MNQPGFNGMSVKRFVAAVRPFLLRALFNPSQPYKSSPQKSTHHVVAVGVFFAIIRSNVPKNPDPSHGNTRPS